jgi:hypothetical protein
MKSPLQKQILNLYAQFIRISKQHPAILPKVRKEFRDEQALPKDDLLFVESKLRRAKYQLNMLKTSRVLNFKVVKPKN